MVVGGWGVWPLLGFSHGKGARSCSIAQCWVSSLSELIAKYLKITLHGFQGSAEALKPTTCYVRVFCKPKGLKLSRLLLRILLLQKSFETPYKVLHYDFDNKGRSALLGDC
jgi:hypothetical protein